jgi:hypothetical protein
MQLAALLPAPMLTRPSARPSGRPQARNAQRELQLMEDEGELPPGASALEGRAAAVEAALTASLALRREYRQQRLLGVPRRSVVRVDAWRWGEAVREAAGALVADLASLTMEQRAERLGLALADGAADVPPPLLLADVRPALCVASSGRAASRAGQRGPVVLRPGCGTCAVRPLQDPLLAYLLRMDVAAALKTTALARLMSAATGDAGVEAMVDALRNKLYRLARKGLLADAGQEPGAAGPQALAPEAEAGTGSHAAQQRAAEAGSARLRELLGLVAASRRAAVLLRDAVLSVRLGPGIGRAAGVVACRRAGGQARPVPQHKAS